MNKKIRVNMLSIADSVDGQGVGSAYIELINLLKEYGKDEFEIQINKSTRNCDIVHSHTVEPINYLKMKFTKKPTIAYVHFLPDTLDGSIKLPKLIFKIFKWYVIKFYKSADNLVVVNPIFKKDMIKAGLKEEKITYIPNFVSKEKFYKKNNKEISRIRKIYGFKDNDFIVLGAGQVMPRKGVLDFIEVAKMMPNVKFVWAGGFSFKNISDGHRELQKVMENPPENVTFLGIVPRDEMNNLFNMSNLLFMPSYNELFPMTILEACSTETPIILRDLELYENILFKKYLRGKDNKDFKDLILKLKNDDKAYNKAIENAKYISDYYSQKSIYKMWKKYYESLIKKS